MAAVPEVVVHCEDGEERDERADALARVADALAERSARTVELADGTVLHVVPPGLRDELARSVRDPLTGLANRTLLLESLHGSLARMARTGRRHAVMFCDLDGFKAVNDAYGHDAGDELLREVAHRLADCVRGSDLVARLGGDEFVIVVDDVGDETTVDLVADHLIDSVGRPYCIQGATLRVGVSIGVTLARADGATAEDLVAEADAAMYRAKRAGKHCYQVFDDALRARMEARGALQRDLGGAVRRSEIANVFTPVVAAATGRLSMLEASLVWQHPEQGELLASDFMPLARERGIAASLTHHALREAAIEAQRWNIHRDAEPLTVWVTVGVHDLLGGDLTSFVAQLVDEVALGPGTLGIDVPLATLDEHPRDVATALQSIAWHGVRVGVDDFGAEAFSPGQLQQFHVDTIKLDRRLVTSASSTPEALMMFAGVVAMGRALGLQVVAKGVASLAQLELAQELGCSLVQGPVIARPGRADAVDEIFDAAPWTDAAWPQSTPRSEPMTRLEVLERLVRLRAEHATT